MISLDHNFAWCYRAKWQNLILKWNYIVVFSCTLVIICKWGCSVSSVSTLLSIKLGQSAFLFSVQRILPNNFHHDYLFVNLNCGESQTLWYTIHRKVLPIRRSLWWKIWLQPKVQKMNFLKCINYFYSSEDNFIPEIKENPNITLSFQYNFWKDFKSYHPRLNNCLGVFSLEDHDKWFIMKDGSLNHVNHSITNEYCIAVLKVKPYI